MENKIWKIRADKKEYALQDLSLTERVNGLTEGASADYNTFAKVETKIKAEASNRTQAIEDKADTIIEYVNQEVGGAKQYSDDNLATAKTYSDGNLDTAKKYTDDRETAILQYVDKEVSDAERYTTESLAAAKQYSDDNLATAKTHSDSNLAAGTAYTNELRDNITNGSITAYKAQRDGNGNKIVDTYASKDEVIRNRYYSTGSRIEDLFYNIYLDYKGRKLVGEYFDEAFYISSLEHNICRVHGTDAGMTILLSNENSSLQIWNISLDSLPTSSEDVTLSSQEVVIMGPDGNANVRGRLMTTTGITVQGGTTTVAGTTTINGTVTLNGGTTTINSQTANFTGKVQVKDINSTNTITLSGQPVLTKFKLVEEATIENNSLSGTSPKYVNIYNIVQLYDEVRIFIYNTNASMSSPMKYFVECDSGEVASIGTGSDAIKMTMEKTGDLQEWRIINHNAATEVTALHLVYGEQEYITTIGIQKQNGSATLTGTHKVWIYAR